MTENTYDTMHASPVTGREGVVDARPAPVAAAPAPRPKRRGLSDEERLAKALADVESLQAKVVAKRDERRQQLIEDLYERYSIEAAADDPGEARRIEQLRAKLGL